MKLKKVTLALVLASLSLNVSIVAEPASKTPIFVKAIIGGTIGGAVMYLLCKLGEKAQNVEFENKDTFLTELQEYVDSAEYKEQKEAGRVFNHFYNGLNQLAAETSGIGVSLLKEFSTANDEATRQALIDKVKALAQRIRANHENGQFYSKIIMTTLGVIGGAAIACDDRSRGGYGNSYTGIYMPSYNSNSFFK